MQSFLVLDASAILAIQQIFSFSDSTESTYFTTPDIIAEFKDQFTKFRVESMIASGELKVRQARIDSLNFIEKETIAIGNNNRLSTQDKSLLALAWELFDKKGKKSAVQVYSDDYEVQNASYILGLQFRPIRTKGITYSTRYIWYCGDCKSKLEKYELKCLDCGSSNLKRKKIKKEILT